MNFLPCRIQAVGNSTERKQMSGVKAFVDTNIIVINAVVINPVDFVRALEV
jgi:hypothetical protein